MVFGRVAKWTISPTIGTNQPRTTTRVLFGDWRRAESFMIQIAIQSQMAIEIRNGIIMTPKQPAASPAACASVSCVGVVAGAASAGDAVCPNKAAGVGNQGRPAIT